MNKQDVVRLAKDRFRRHLKRLGVEASPRSLWRLVAEAESAESAAVELRARGLSSVQITALMELSLLTEAERAVLKRSQRW